ncbi:MAG: ribbon-helix-helix protein, CopG family [Ilumatobacteraceae bacterium]|jgi:Arc/MetJ-type ribon-helix-helix transcriptional regulator
MKISVSLPEEDVAFLDDYAREAEGSSRSAAVHDAIALLRTAHLMTDYAQAFDEWIDSGEAAVWDAVVADGLE